ncbi:MAG: dicarboxylate/amino acid:cation symporter [Bacteroidia bacterium]|nr:MAG: dicarboxylate/amino acid:cation symporter [Bacteroidia bacterium]
MKIFKLELHWQILIALIIGVVYGILFAPTYSISDNTLKILVEEEVPQAVISQLAPLKGAEYYTEELMIEAIKKAIGEDNAVEYEDTIIAEADYTDYITYVSWLGELFMRGLKMIIVPLILSSIVSGVTNIGNAENLGRLGLKTMLYYIVTSLFAIITGLLFVNAIRPGDGVSINNAADAQTLQGMEFVRESFGQTLINMVPTNVFETFADGQMLSVIFFSILFGFFITKVSDKARDFLTTFFNSTFEVMMKITLFVIQFTPLGIIGIVATTVSENIINLAELAVSMAGYMLTVFLALMTHAMVTLPLLTGILGKANPWKHFKNMSSALLTAFSTSSSGATLSLTMESVENRSGVSGKITSFTLPLGATINMDGTALYECVAAMFIAQAYGIELDFIEQIIVVITALLASIGAASIPMAGLVMISIILSAVGLPLEGVGLILAVDRILDMFRTATNVWSDSCGAVVIAKSEGETLKV